MEDRGGQGIETIKEVDACPACAAKHGNTPPAPSPDSPGDAVGKRSQPQADPEPPADEP